MTYSLAIRKSVDGLFSKLARRDPVRLRLIEKKIGQVLAAPTPPSLQAPEGPAAAPEASASG